MRHPGRSSKFGGYFNVDSGTGRIRGASVFGPPAAAAVLRAAFAPFEDLGLMGATNTRSRRASGTDSTSFNQAGLPGIGLSQDPIEYGSYTWHTSLDTYERIIEEDVKKSAIVNRRRQVVRRDAGRDAAAIRQGRHAAASTAKGRGQ